MISDGVEYHRSDAPITCWHLPVGMLPITSWRMRVHFCSLSKKIFSEVLSRSWCVDRGFRRLSICSRLYSLVEYGKITIPTPSVSSSCPTATLHQFLNVFNDTRLENICKSMSKRSWITHLVSKEVHSMKEYVQHQNSPPFLLLPQHSHTLDQQLYSLEFLLYSLAFTSSQHQNSVGT